MGLSDFVELDKPVAAKAPFCESRPPPRFCLLFILLFTGSASFLYFTHYW